MEFIPYEVKTGYENMQIDSDLLEYAIKNLGIAPCETLFLDDSQKNLDTAQILGFKTALVAPGTEFADILKTAAR